jgi:hypothetical protein
VRASQAKHVIAIGEVLEAADKVKGSETNNDGDSSALQVIQNRGILSSEEIAKIVGPFK